MKKLMSMLISFSMLFSLGSSLTFVSKADTTVVLEDDLTDLTHVFATSGAGTLQIVNGSAANSFAGTDWTGVQMVNKDAPRFLVYQVDGGETVTAKYQYYAATAEISKNRVAFYSSPDNVTYTAVAATYSLESEYASGESWKLIDAVTGALPSDAKYVKIVFDQEWDSWHPIITSVKIEAEAQSAVLDDDLVDFSNIYTTSGTGTLQLFVGSSASQMPGTDFTGLQMVNKDTPRYIVYEVEGGAAVSGKYMYYAANETVASGRFTVYSSPDNATYTSVTCTYALDSEYAFGGSWKLMDFTAAALPSDAKYVKLVFDQEWDVWQPILTSVHVVGAVLHSKTFVLPSYYGDNMMFQQQKDIHVSGKATAGATVTAALKKESDSSLVDMESVTAGTDGKFMVPLPAMNASFTEYKLEVTDGHTLKTFHNILIGELWVSGGQSNMELQTQYCDERDALMSTANNPNIRIFYQQTLPMGLDGQYPVDAQDDLIAGGWVKGDSGSNVAACSAVAYSFVRKLYDDLNASSANIPVGVINTALGATSIEAWISRGAIESDANFKQSLEDAGVYVSESEWNNKLAPSLRYNQMSALYNTKIAAFKNFNVKGIIWYQGENNCGGYDMLRYGLPLLANDWSAVFGSPSERLPFVYTQLAPLFYNWQQTTGYSSTVLAQTNEALTDAYDTMKAVKDNAAMITISDLSLKWQDATDGFTSQFPGHPLAKRTVGERMTTAAEKCAYGDASAVAMGPKLKSMTISGNKAILKFDNVGTGLTTIGNDPAIRGFAIAGSNLTYIDASARITASDTIEVWNDTVTAPTAVSYSFFAMSNYANLTGSTGLPAIPFRTDRTARRTAITGTGALYAMPYPWMWADSLQFFTYTNINDAGNHDVWSAAPILAKGTVAFSEDTSVKQEGLGSLKVSYTASSTGKAGFGPELSYPSLLTLNLDYEQYLPLEAYSTISVDVRNGDAHDKLLQIMVKNAQNQVFYLGYGATSAAKVTASSGFTTYTFDLKSLFDADGVTKLSGTSVLATANKLEFIVSDGNGASGSVNVDNIRYGLGTYVTPANSGTPVSDQEDVAAAATQVTSVFDDLVDATHFLEKSDNMALSRLSDPANALYQLVDTKFGKDFSVMMRSDKQDGWVTYNCENGTKATVTYYTYDPDRNGSLLYTETSTDGTNWERIDATPAITRDTSDVFGKSVLTVAIPAGAKQFRIHLVGRANAWDPILASVKLDYTQAPASGGPPSSGDPSLSADSSNGSPKTGDSGFPWLSAVPAILGFLGVVGLRTRKKRVQ